MTDSKLQSICTSWYNEKQISSKELSLVHSDVFYLDIAQLQRAKSGTQRCVVDLDIAQLHVCFSLLGW